MMVGSGSTGSGSGTEGFDRGKVRKVGGHKAKNKGNLLYIGDQSM